MVLVGLTEVRGAFVKFCEAQGVKDDVGVAVYPRVRSRDNGSPPSWPQNEKAPRR